VIELNLQSMKDWVKDYRKYSKKVLFKELEMSNLQSLKDLVKDYQISFITHKTSLNKF